MMYRAGDIAACYGTDLVSRGISFETFNPLAPSGLRWGPSHVAIVCEQDQCGPLRWFESTTMCRRRCLIRGDEVSGCQVHSIDDRIHDYRSRGGRVDFYRLSHLDTLTNGERNHLRRMLVSMVERKVGYDLSSAILSGTRFISRLSFFHDRLDDVFCSQLIAAVLQRRNRMNRRNPQWFNPGRLLRTLVNEGTYVYSHTEKAA